MTCIKGRASTWTSALEAVRCVADLREFSFSETVIKTAPDGMVEYSALLKSQDDSEATK